MAACPGEEGYVGQNGECVKCERYVFGGGCADTCTGTGKHILGKQCLATAECAGNGLTTACARPTSASDCANGIFSGQHGKTCLVYTNVSDFLFKTSDGTFVDACAGTVLDGTCVDTDEKCKFSVEPTMAPDPHVCFPYQCKVGYAFGTTCVAHCPERTE